MFVIFGYCEACGKATVGNEPGDSSVARDSADAVKADAAEGPRDAGKADAAEGSIDAVKPDAAESSMPEVATPDAGAFEPPKAEPCAPAVVPGLIALWLLFSFEATSSSPMASAVVPGQLKFFCFVFRIRLLPQIPCLPGRPHHWGAAQRP